MIFLIKKGRHFSDKFFHKILNLFNTETKLCYNVIFDDNCIYNDETEDKYDVNKLFGFSNGLHHKNSYRFGWNSLGGVINMYSYSYINGKRTIKEMCTLELNKKYRMTIRLKGEKCIYTITDSKYNMFQTSEPIKTDSVFGYRLWPYFGGNKSAPKIISIYLDKTL